jgi:hypothetical protein
MHRRVRKFRLPNRLQTRRRGTPSPGGGCLANTGPPRSNAWSARQRPACVTPQTAPDVARAPHDLPGQIGVRAHLALHGSIELNGAALAIETGADFAISPIHRGDPACRPLLRRCSHRQRSAPGHHGSNASQPRSRERVPGSTHHQDARRQLRWYVRRSTPKAAALRIDDRCCTKFSTNFRDAHPVLTQVLLID